MTTYRHIKASRRLAWSGIVIGYCLALAVAGANLGSDDGTLLTAIAFLAALSLPPSLAFLSLDRRPALLTAASMSALVQGGLLLTSLGLLELVPAILWYQASQRRPRPAPDPRGAPWIRPALALATVVPLLAMILHLDPLCVVTDADGSVVRTYVEEGAKTGWILSMGSYSTGSSEGGTEGTTHCTSNRTVPWEAAASLSLSAFYLAMVTVSWPTADRVPVVSDHRA